jgi:Ca2+/H+ antiporter
MSKRYEPPVQSGAGQFFDSLVVLVLVYVSLMAPLLFKGATGAPADAADKPPVTWESLKQTPAMVEQWERLGVDPKTAEPMVTNRFDYTIEPVSLIVTIVVIVGYFIFLLRTSDREYREVIRERFGPAKGD